MRDLCAIAGYHQKLVHTKPFFRELDESGSADKINTPMEANEAPHHCG
jgi:hypothetical protein